MTRPLTITAAALVLMALTFGCGGDGDDNGDGVDCSKDEQCEYMDGLCFKGACVETCSSPRSCEAGEVCFDTGSGLACVASENLPCVNDESCTSVMGDECHEVFCSTETGRCEVDAFVDDTPCGTSGGDLCLGNSVCKSGICQDVTDPVVCDDSGDTDCMENRCDSTDGICKLQPKQDGLLCNDDADMCNGVFHCSGGTCFKDVQKVECDVSGDNECRTTSCDPADGICKADKINEGGTCDDDDDACNGINHCVDGYCVQDVEDVICDTTGDNQCLTTTCDPLDGQCKEVVAVDGTSCDDDGDACNGTSVCTDGACSASSDPITCDTSGDTLCLATVCDPTDGACKPKAINEGGICDDDEDACNGVSHCLAGTCYEDVDTVVCDPPPVPDCQTAVCDPADGVCKPDPINEGAICGDDGNMCNGVSHCLAGACEADVLPVECDPSSDTDCVVSKCDVADGACKPTDLPDGTLCASDGDLCNGVSHCAAGECLEDIVPVVCDTSSDGPCELTACDPTTGECSQDGLPDGSICADDGDLCNGTFSCLAGSCQVADDPVVCDTTSDPQCQVTSCDPVDGECKLGPAEEGLPCDDGDLCNGTSTCVEGACAPTGDPVVCDTSTDTPCLITSCDPATGQCNQETLDDGTTCDDDGDLCNGVSHCYSGLCLQDVASVLCDTSTDTPCKTTACDTTTGQCKISFSVNGETCDDDGDLCTGYGHCDATMACVMDAPAVTCDAGGDTTCLANQCDPALGECQMTPVADGTVCDDELAYTDDDQCIQGACVGVAADCGPYVTFDRSLLMVTAVVGSDGVPGQGLDVDLDATTCAPPDTCTDGIDNAAAPLEGLFSSFLEQALLDGSFYLVHDLIAPTSDGEVFSIKAFEGIREFSAGTCDPATEWCTFSAMEYAFDTQCVPRFVFDNATYDGTTLTAGGPGSTAATGSQQGAGLEGDGMTLHHVQLDGTLTLPTDGSQATFSGLLGCAIDKDEFTAFALAGLPADFPFDPDTVAQMLDTLVVPDIDTTGDGVANAFSLGLLVELAEVDVTTLYVP